MSISGESTNSSRNGGNDPTNNPLDIISSKSEDTSVLANDPSGLCLAKQGSLSTTSTTSSGIYTDLVRLASQLQPPVNRGGINTREGSGNGGGDASSQQQQQSSPHPLITLEMDKATILVKEYDGHAVALKLPSNYANDNSSHDRQGRPRSASTNEDSSTA